MNDRPAHDRITYVVPRFLPSLGGIENHVAAISHALVEAGRPIQVATQIESSDAVALRETLPDGIDVVRFRSRLPILGQGVSLGLGRFAAAIARSGEIVHLHNYHALTSLYAGRMLAGVPDAGPFVITPHYLGVGAGPTQAAMHSAYRRAFTPVFDAADAVVSVCASEAHLLMNDFDVPAAKIAMIPNGVDTELLASAEPLPFDRRSIVVAGRLVGYKGHLSVLRALAELPPDYDLVVAGQGPLDRELIDVATELGVTERLHLLGRLTADQLAGWYATASVVVSMSARECFGLTLVEALAAGAPIVASDIGPHQDVAALCGYSDDALLPLDSSPARLANAIRTAVEGGRHPPGTYAVPNWTQSGKLHSQLYNELVARAA